MSDETGVRLCVNGPDDDDPDHRFHGEIKTVEEVLEDNLSDSTDDPRDDFLNG